MAQLKKQRLPPMGSSRCVSWKVPRDGPELVFKTRVALTRQWFDSATFQLRVGRMDEW